MKKTLIIVAVYFILAGYVFAKGMGTGMDMGMSPGGGTGGSFPLNSFFLLSNGTDSMLLANATDKLIIN